MEKEIWKVYHEGPKVKWEVSNLGNVKRNGIVYECKTVGRYFYFGGGIHVHRAVAELFIPNPQNKPCVDHIDTNTKNNVVDNLRWTTWKENSNNPLTIQHMKETLNKPEVKIKYTLKGERNGFYNKHHTNELRNKFSKMYSGRYKVYDNKELNIYHYEK